MFDFLGDLIRAFMNLVQKRQLIKKIKKKHKNIDAESIQDKLAKNECEFGNISWGNGGPR